LLDQPDINTSSKSIDQFVLLFGSNTNLGSTFYFDNFDSYAPATSVPSNEREEDDAFLIYPNPTRDYIILKKNHPTKGDVMMYDIYGKVVTPYPISISESNQLINISHLAAGIYFLKFNQKNKHQKILRFTKT